MNAYTEAMSAKYVISLKGLSQVMDDEGNQDTSGHPELHSNTQYISYHRGNHIFISELKQFPLSNVISCNRRQY
jgi:hypothetical protein